jgi:hypothetical protein
VKDKSAHNRLDGFFDIIRKQAGSIGKLTGRIVALEHRVKALEPGPIELNLIPALGGNEPLPEFGLDKSGLVNVAIGRKAPLLFEYERDPAVREAGEEPQLRIASLYERRRNGNGSETVVGFDHVRGEIRQYRVDRILDDSVVIGEPDAFVPPVVEPPAGHETDYAPTAADVRQRPDETIAEAKAKTDSWLDEPRAVRDNPQG